MKVGTQMPIDDIVLTINKNKEDALMHRGQFHIRWNNGAWKIFDSHDFRDCEKFPSLQLAKEVLHA